MLFRTILFLAFINVPFTGTEGKITTFSGKWQFDEAHSSYNLTTKVIKDLPDHLKVKIPNYDVPRLAGVPRYFSTSPILVINVVGGRLTISAPQWFTGWIPYDAEFLVDGKQREKNVGVGGHRYELDDVEDIRSVFVKIRNPVKAK